MTDGPLNLDELERLAKAATPGPWGQMDDWPLEIVQAEQKAMRLGASAYEDQDRITYAQPIFHAVFDSFCTWTHRRCNRGQAKADAAFIAALNPSTVLQLIAMAKKK